MCRYGLPVFISTTLGQLADVGGQHRSRRGAFLRAWGLRTDHESVHPRSALEALEAHYGVPGIDAIRFRRADD